MQPDLGVVLLADFTVVVSRVGLVPRAAAASDLGADFLTFLTSVAGQTLLAEQAGLPAVSLGLPDGHWPGWCAALARRGQPRAAGLSGSGQTPGPDPPSDRGFEPSKLSRKMTVRLLPGSYALVRCRTRTRRCRSIEIWHKTVPWELGQQITVENVGGAGCTLGAAQIAGAEADGYSILLHHIGMATSATLYRQLPYDPRTAFSYVGLVTEVPMTIVARAYFEPTDFASLLTGVKESADTITMANAGIGAASHLCGMLFMQAIETPLVTVPYRGNGPAMTKLIGGQIDISDQTTNTTEQIQGGTIKAYAVTTPARLDLFPDLPTVAEAALPVPKCRSGTAFMPPLAPRPRRMTGCRLPCKWHWPMPMSSPGWPN